MLVKLKLAEINKRKSNKIIPTINIKNQKSKIETHENIKNNKVKLLVKLKLADNQ